ncbi:MAG: hypothetical protein M3525_02120 [Acidobacteriota bacterium]|nr:hypothetical protein [Acidobacteriota bacterium]
MKQDSSTAVNRCHSQIRPAQIGCQNDFSIHNQYLGARKREQNHRTACLNKPDLTPFSSDVRGRDARAPRDVFRG